MGFCHGKAFPAPARLQLMGRVLLIRLPATPIFPDRADFTMADATCNKCFPQALTSASLTLAASLPIPDVEANPGSPPSMAVSPTLLVFPGATSDL